MSTWQSREYNRLVDGTYKRVPVSLDYPLEHYVHLSTTTESDVAYTPSDEYGKRDRRIHLRFGRYLKKVFPKMSDAEIQGHVTALKSALSIADSPATLKFTTSRDIINEIFETEMCACGSTATSCMHGKFTEWENRPYHVYADSPDVAVAYVMAQGEIVSRSVVSTKDKTWVRAYSRAGGNNDADCGTLKAMLKDAGYSKGELTDNRLTNVDKRKGKPILPYIDNGGAYVRDDGKYWYCLGDGSDGADYQADCTDGTGTACGNRCSCCDEPEDECECTRCECCEELSRYGCDECSMCENCDCCTEHDNCDCDRCGECREIINPRRRYVTRCECSRCSECSELESECTCDKCDVCDELESNCTCEVETEMEVACETR